MSDSQVTVFDALGGTETIRQLVDAFYPKVAEDPDLRPLFPDDFTEIQEKQYQFLTQFFGGPPLYSQVHGAPMLRARHTPFEITPKRVQAWLRCMSEAIDEVGIDGGLREFMFERLTLTAHHMVNAHEEDGSSEARRPMLKVQARAFRANPSNQ